MSRLPHVVAMLLAVAAGVLAIPTAAAQDVVRVVITTGVGTDDGVLAVGPSAQVADPDTVSWTIVNGTTVRTSVGLDMVTLGTTADGTIAAGTSLGLAFELQQVVLDGGAAATLSVPTDALAGHIADGLALVVSTDAGDLLGVVVSSRGAPSGVDVALVRDDGRLRGRLELATGQSLLTDMRARLLRWPSRVVADRELRNVVVLPPGRKVDLDLAGTAFVGPVDLEVLAGIGADTAVASSRAWIVNRTAVRSAGTVVLVVTTAFVTVGFVRLRRRSRDA